MFNPFRLEISRGPHRVITEERSYFYAEGGPTSRLYVIADRMDSVYLTKGPSKNLVSRMDGQSMVEFAMILPLFVLFIVGVFELGRAFFSYIAITNAAREGTRVMTFWPGKATITDIDTAVQTELGNSPMVTWNSAEDTIEIFCGAAYTKQTNNLNGCVSAQPIRVTVTYKFHLLLQIFFSSPLILTRSAEMMVP